MKEELECYNSGYQDGFNRALEIVLDKIKDLKGEEYAD